MGISSGRGVTRAGFESRYTSLHCLLLDEFAEGFAAVLTRALSTGRDSTTANLSENSSSTSK